MEKEPDTYPEIEKIIWDADNTFWNWIRYAAMAYQSMSDCIAQETGIPEPEVAAAMKRYYSQTGTMEDAGLIQGIEITGFFIKSKKYDRDDLIGKVRKVFADIRRRFLRTYMNIGGVLKTAHDHGKENIVLSDAPGIHATQRLIRSQLAPHISRVYARKTQKIDDLPYDVQKKIREGSYKPPFEVIEIESEKPDTDLPKILRLRGKKREKANYIKRHVAIVGDNRAKDMALAEKWGCLGLHALWGYGDSDDLATLKRFAPESVAAKNAYLPPPNEKGSDNPRIIGIDDPREILRILDL